MSPSLKKGIIQFLFLVNLVVQITVYTLGQQALSVCYLLC